MIETNPTTNESSNLAQLREVLSTDHGDKATALLRLQGWRGPDLDQASGVILGHRLGPAACAIGAFTGGLLTSPALLALMAFTAVVGAVAANHPVEVIYNRVARWRGRVELPTNRAARRLGCAAGAIFLGGAAVSIASGHTSVGIALALSIGFVAAFVAATGICIPSMIFTLMWGSERATAPTLWEASDVG